MKRIAPFTIALALIGSITACQPKSGNQPPPPKALMKMDRDLLVASSSAGPEAYDRSNRKLYSKIFGGTSGAAVSKYLDERLKYYFEESDLDGWIFASGNPTYRDWKKTDEADKPEETKTRQRAVVGASNIGTGLFFQGAVEGTPVRIKKGDEEITFDSTRVGMMLVGPGYAATAKVAFAVNIDVPTSYRQAILVHEARHSDCSVATGVSDFAVARSSRSYRDFLERFKNIECGHAHAICPKGHDFAGLPACDRQAFGAYTVDAVFSAARLKDPSIGAIERRILESSTVSAFGRMLKDVEAMRDGEYGEPQMKHIPFKW